jgi:hypothetical protein
MTVVFGVKNSHCRRPSQSQNTVTIAFLADGSVLNFLLAGNMLALNTH